MTEPEITALAFEALDHAVGYIQREMDIMEGDAAAAIFSDGKALRILEEYIRYEMERGV